MVDWPGLLKWSLKYQDQTTENKQLKQMDQQTYKWLTEAFESVAINEIEEMKKLITTLNEVENASDPNDEENRLTLLDQLFNLVESLDRAQDLCKLDGMQLLLKIIIESKYKELRILANQIFQFCNQNKSDVQSYSISIGAFKLVNIIINEKEEMAIREFTLSSLSSLIKGECLEAKRNFIDMDGIQLILEILANKIYSQRLRTKAILLLKDLIFYDEKLHFTYNDTSAFQNTNINLNGKMKPSTKIENQSQINAQKQNKSEQQQQQQQQKNVQQEENKQSQQASINNELEENKKYKNYVKNFLISQFNFMELYEQFLNDTNLPNLDLRCAYLFVAKELMKYKADILDSNANSKFLQFIVKHQKQIEIENKKNDGSYWHEIELLKELQQILKQQK